MSGHVPELNVAPSAAFQSIDVPQQLRILVVDDEDIDRMALRRMLEKSGLNVTLREAECAAEAFEVISKDPFDCVLLDYLLPEGPCRFV